MKYKWFISLLSIFLIGAVIIILIGKPQQEVAFIGDITEFDYVPQGSGTGYGLVSDDRKSVIDERNFRVRKNDKLKLNVMFSNGSMKETEFLIIPMVNYSLSEMKIREKKRKNIRVKLKSNQLATIPVSLSSFKDGINDVIFLIVINPDTTEISDAYRMKTEFNHVLGIRLSVVVGEPNMHEIDYTNNEYRDNTVLTGLFLSKDNTELRQWYKENIGGRNNISFVANVGNFEEQNYTYALVSMNNWEQVSTLDNEYVVFGKIPPNKMVQINWSIKLADDARKVSNFTTILIPQPFKIYERKKRMEIEAAARVALVQ
jgi:hypothetical protein